MVATALDSVPDRRILILSANPAGTGRLRLDNEVRKIEEGLQRSMHRDRFEIKTRWAICPRDIRLALLEYRPHIVHFSGHGDRKGIMVEGELGLAEPVSAQVLSGLFELCAHQVECVVLNACYSVHQASIIKRHIKYVIGMKKEIEDRAAIEFAVGFYDSLGAGESVEKAFKIGRLAILQMYPGLPKHLIPMLKKRKDKTINILIQFESTNNIFSFEAALSERTMSVKNRLIEKLKLSKTFADGHLINYYLLSKTRNKVLDDAKTVIENGVQDNEVLVFLLEIESQ